MSTTRIVMSTTQIIRRLLEKGTLLPPTTITSEASSIAYSLGWDFNNLAGVWYNHKRQKLLSEYPMYDLQTHKNVFFCHSLFTENAWRYWNPDTRKWSDRYARFFDCQEDMFRAAKVGGPF
jgi:hypothetical protein